MRVRRRTAAALGRAWWIALALTLGYAAVVLILSPRTAPSVAALRVARLVPSPARGVPGPTPAGAIPLPVAPAIDLSVTPARPFALGQASAIDRSRALRCLADAVYYESAGQPEAGQRGVAQVILNRVRDAAYPATVCGVVYQGAPGRGCQFSFACDGSLARVPWAAGWASAAQIAAAALAGRVEPAVGLATYYHSYAVAPAWNRGLVMTDAIGAHFFHRRAGAQGAPGAFDRPYRGGEPALPLPVTTPAPPVIAAATGPAAAAPVATPAATPVDQPPPQPGDILPRWRDSGKPL